MRVFMLGWEFPPFISGGLGTACYGLTKGLSAIGVDVLFVLPRPIATPHSTHVTLAAPRPRPAGTASPHGFIAQAAGDGSGAFDHVTFRTVDAGLADPYRSANGYADDWFPEPAAGSPPPPGPPMPAGWVVTEGSRPGTGAPVTPPASPSAPGPGAYGGDLFAEVQRYAALAGDIARTERFDVVHAHDWMTFPAGLAAAGIRGVPLVVHVHSTEHDRSGLHVDQRIYDIERRGMLGAMRVIAVSQMTKNQCVQRYDVPPAKVTVVHNAVEANGTGRDATGADGPAADPDAEADPAPPDAGAQEIRRGEKIVLFLGRLTMQKGPEYFLAAAKRVLGVMDGVKFVMAGSGDLARRTVEQAAAMGIGHKVLFTGFLRGADVDRVFRMADLYVMPSVSEPFGISTLEAMSHDVPVIISKQSGVSEVLTHALKVDFWDVEEMANKIVAVLKHPPLAGMLREHGGFEVRKLTWVEAARACVAVYERAMAGGTGGEGPPTGGESFGAG